jgi:hypothetical protein
MRYAATSSTAEVSVIFEVALHTGTSGSPESDLTHSLCGGYCFAAYYAKSRDELSGRTTGRLGHGRPDSAYAIGGTAELALRYSNQSPHPTTGPRH